MMNVRGVEPEAERLTPFCLSTWMYQSGVQVFGYRCDIAALMVLVHMVVLLSYDGENLLAGLIEADYRGQFIGIAGIFYSHAAIAADEKFL